MYLGALLNHSGVGWGGVTDIDVTGCVVVAVIGGVG